jgi:hypothetical protein
MTQQAQAQIVGEVEYREGDGATQPIPPGPVEVAVTQQDATLSWEDGDTRHAAAMPLTDFERYEREGKIQVEGELEAQATAEDAQQDVSA